MVERSIWQYPGKRVPLGVHHINGDVSDNCPSNLRLVPIPPAPIVSPHAEGIIRAAVLTLQRIAAKQ